MNLPRPIRNDVVYTMNYVRVFGSSDGETIKSSMTTLLRDLRWDALSRSHLASYWTV